MIALILGFLALIGIGVCIYMFMFKQPNVGVMSSTTMAEHSDADGDCWVAYHGNVYDMTRYARKHPGGRSVITDHCGTDATEWYDREHSVSLLSKVDRYMVGTLEA